MGGCGEGEGEKNRMCSGSVREVEGNDPFIGETGVYFKLSDHVRAERQVFMCVMCVCVCV